MKFSDMLKCHLHSSMRNDDGQYYSLNFSPRTFSMRADRWHDEEMNIEFLEIAATSFSNIAFRKLEVDMAVDTFIEGDSCGRYTLIVKNEDKFVLAKGELNRMREH